MKKQKEEVQIKRAADLSFASNKLKILPTVLLKKEFLDPAKPILFIHPPKTAGTNIANLAKAITIEQGTIELRAVVPKQEGKSPNLFIEGKVGGLETVKADPKCFDCSTKDVKFISGHMPLPSLENEFTYFCIEGLNCIGIIRDPVDRELSSANFDYQRKYVEASEIQDYILNKPIDNLQTRLLAGERYMVGECNEETLEAAKQNILSRFKFVAPSEDVELVMSLLSTHFEIKHVAYARAQVTGIKVVDKTNTGLCEALRVKHHYDYSLYQWVREQWQVWKEEYIESIEEVEAYDEQYLVLNPFFSQTKKPELMYLSQIEQLDGHGELIPLQQKLAISDNKQLNNLLLEDQHGQPSNEQEELNIVKIEHQTNSYFDVSSVGSFLQQIIRFEPNIRYVFKIINIELPKFYVSSELRAIADFGTTFLKYNNIKMIPYQILESGSYFANLKIYELLNNNHQEEKIENISTFVEKCGSYIVAGGLLGFPNQTPIMSGINGAAVCIQNYHINSGESFLAKTARIAADLGFSVYLVQQKMPIMQMITGVVALDVSIQVAYVTGELILNSFIGEQQPSQEDML